MAPPQPAPLLLGPQLLLLLLGLDRPLVLMEEAQAPGAAVPGAGSGNWGHADLQGRVPHPSACQGPPPSPLSQSPGPALPGAPFSSD